MPQPARCVSPAPQRHLGPRRGTCAFAAFRTVPVHAAPASPARSRPRGLAISFLFLSPQDVTPSARSHHSALNPVSCRLCHSTATNRGRPGSARRRRSSKQSTKTSKFPSTGSEGPGSRRPPPSGDPLLIPPSAPCSGPSHNDSSALFRIFRLSNFITSAQDVFLTFQQRKLILISARLGRPFSQLRRLPPLLRAQGYSLSRTVTLGGGGGGADDGDNAKTAIPATDRKGRSRQARHPCRSSTCIHSFTGHSGRCEVGDAVFLILGEDIKAPDG